MLQRFIKKLARDFMYAHLSHTEKRKKAHQEPFCEFRKVKLSHDWCETLQPPHPWHGLGEKRYRPQ